MASSNAKALNGMKQKLRKTTKTYQDVLDKLRADEGKVEDEDEEDDEDTDEDEMTGPGTFMKVTSKKLAKQEAPSKAVPKKEQGPKKIADYNEADIDKKLDELLAVRGRKGTKKMEQVEGTTVFDTTQMTTAEIDEDDEEVFYDAGVTQMTGSILSYLERQDDEEVFY